MNLKNELILSRLGLMHNYQYVVEQIKLRNDCGENEYSWNISSNAIKVWENVDFILDELKDNGIEISSDLYHSDSYANYRSIKFTW